MGDGELRANPMLRHTGLWRTERPRSIAGALAATAPHGTPERTQPELLALRERVQDAIDLLDDVEIAVFDAWVVERVGLKPIAERMTANGYPMTKSTAHRMKDRVVAKLRLALENDPLVIEHLKG
jgi:hypothetical protein